MQALNKARALEMLKARLLVVAQEQQLQEIAQIRGDLVKAGERSPLLGLVAAGFRLAVVMQRYGGTGEGRRALPASPCRSDFLLPALHPLMFHAVELA